ncbi:MAG TPA: hypothetical protein QGI39_12395, partial [Gammaproteobacteria bacterium]|nr:hypothetical protein [Gammaproteobacteria bacterium]
NENNKSYKGCHYFSTKKQPLVKMGERVAKSAGGYRLEHPGVRPFLCQTETNVSLQDLTPSFNTKTKPDQQHESK